MNDLFLILLTAHLAGDFLLQTAGQVAGKRAGEPKALLRHGAGHWIAVVLLLLGFAPQVASGWRTHVILLLLIAGHLAIDAIKERVPELPPAKSVCLFLTDQLAHVLLLLLVAGAIAGTTPISITGISARLLEHRQPVLTTAAIYLAVVFGGGYLIQLALATFRKDPSVVRREAVEAGEGAESRPGIRNAGLYIGWLERTIILSSIAVGAQALVGLVIAAKAIIRFKESDTPFAEYFLLGTFLSLLLAGAGAFLLKALVRPLLFAG